MNHFITHISHSFSKQTWGLILIAFIFVLRKTIFNVSKEAGSYEATVDSSTSLAMVGILLTLYVIIRNWAVCKEIGRSTHGLLLYYFFAWLSFLWAGSFTTISFKAIENICNILLMGLIILSINDNRKVLFFIIFFSTACVCLDLARYYMLSGFRWYHTNAYTIPAFIGLLLSIGCIKHKLFSLKELLPFIVIDFYAWLSGTSTASYISAIIGFIILFSSSDSGIKIGRTILVCIVTYIIWSFYEEEILTFVTKDNVKKFETGTGRFILWEAAINSWKEAPWFGKGYIIGETGLGGFRQISSHNSFISVLVNTGVIGSVIFVYFIFQWIIKSYKCSKYNVYASISFPVIIAICVNLNSCPVLASHWSHITDCVLAVVAATCLTFVDDEDNVQNKDT